MTAHQIHLVDQLLEAIQKELKEQNMTTGVKLIDWRNEENRDLNSIIDTSVSSKDISLFVMTSQSLKMQLEALEPENYESLLSNLEGLFIDEAHHLGAYQQET